MISTQHIFILLFIFKWQTVAILYKPNDDAHGLRVSFNDDFVIAAFNNENKYYIRFLSTNKDIECVIPYKHDKLYVYSLAVLKTKEETKIFSFIQISENETTNDAIISLIGFTFTTCNRSSSLTSTDRILWTTGHKESILLKVDRQEKYAYIFADSVLLTYDLSSHKIQQNFIFNNSDKVVIPIAFDLTNEWAFMIGYTLASRISYRHHHLYMFHLTSNSLFTCDNSNNTFSSFISTANTHSYDHDVSISMDLSGNLLAMGFPSINRVHIFDTSHMKPCSFRTIENIQLAYHLNVSGAGFGRSVAWLNDHGALAVLVYNTKNQVPPESVIYVFKTIFKNKETLQNVPDFTFPNNQQMLPKNWTTKSFLLIRAYSHNLVVLCDNHRYLYIPSANAGSCPVLYDEKPKNAFVLQPKPCVSGTYKNTKDIGPCIICPSGTKNSGVRPAMHCQPCSPGSFCPLGASGELSSKEFTRYESYNQTFKYPESPLLDDYDDMLMRNFFVVEKTIACKLKLPRIWTLLAIIIGFILWLIMFSDKKAHSSSVNAHRNRAKIFLKQIDIIGEGEKLVGGLASLVVLTIIIHSCWFANDYFHSYPIETVNSSRLQCRNNQTNSKFSNALQLLLSETDGDYETLFDMLDKQNFTMTIHLINTGAKCNSIIVERLRHMGTSERLLVHHCTFSEHNITGSFSFNLSTHTDSIQVTIEGPYFIGALRICLYGNKGVDKREEQRRYQLAELDVCTLFFTDNQTVGISNHFNVHLIKVVNVTEPLLVEHETNYTGRWAPYIKYTDDLSDEYYFRKDGQYLRYAWPTTIFRIQFSEEFYFLENNQSPIVRSYELIFHTFLFIFLIIDVFGMAFIVYKLWFQPLLKRFLLDRTDTRRQELQSSHTETVIDSSIRQSKLSGTMENNDSRRGQSSVLFTSSSSTEKPCLSNHLAVEHLFEYFDKRMNVAAQNIEHLLSEVATMRNHIDELMPLVLYLKQQMSDIRQNNKNEYNDNVSVDLAYLQRKL